MSVSTGIWGVTTGQFVL